MERKMSTNNGLSTEMKSVLVMLSTYNGEKFLSEQLDSLFGQKDVYIHVLVRDDGSKDSTIEILKRYKCKNYQMTIIEGQNVGAGCSFYELMAVACRDFPNYDYYAFSDQDDVWFSNKLSKAVDKLEKFKNDARFLMYFCKYIPTDIKLIPIRTYSLPQKNNLAANMVHNRILGCTQVFNFALLQKAAMIVPRIENIKSSGRHLTLHDGWTAIVGYALNAIMISSDEKLMYYRQHMNNVVGVGGGMFSLWRKRISRYFFHHKTNIKSAKSLTLLETLGDELPYANKELIALCASYQDTIYKRLKLATTREIYQAGVMDNIGVFIAIMLGRF